MKKSVYIVTALVLACLMTAGSALQALAYTEIDFVSPRGGEIMLADTQFAIQWEVSSSFVSYVEVAYSPDNETTWYPIFADKNPSIQVYSFYWTVPQTTGSNCKIRLRYYGVAGTQEEKISQGFTIYPSDYTPINPLRSNQPATPTELKAQIVSNNSIQLNWTDNADDETIFVLERQINSVAPMVYLATLPANTTEYTDNAMEAGKSYQYRIKAANIYGDSLYSNECDTRVEAPPVLPVPETPTGLKATAISATEVDLQWKDNSSSETSYILEHKRKDAIAFVPFATLPADTTSYTDTGLTADRAYEYRVKARNASGDSEYSAVAEVTTLPGPVMTSGSRLEVKFFADSNYYTQNSSYKEMDVAPYIEEKRLLLPVQYVCSALGATSRWDDSEQKATITWNDKKIELWLNRNTAIVDGAETYIDPVNPAVVPLTLPPGRIMVPLRFVAESLGCGVSWDQVTRTATILYEVP